MNDHGFSYHVSKFFTEFLPRQKGCSPNTIQSYRDAFVLLLKFLRERHGIRPEQICYCDLSAQRIEEFISWLEDSRNAGVRTCNQRLAAIHSFCRYLQIHDPEAFELCSSILAVQFRKAPISVVSYMSVEEVGILLKLPDLKFDDQLRDLAIIAMLYETGGRVQEIIDLTPSNLRFSGKRCTVELHGKGNKSRLVPMNENAASIIRKYITRHGRTDECKPLFVNKQDEKLSRAGIQYIIDKYVSMARALHPNLFKEKFSNHSFRHSKAMHLLEAGVNLVYIRDLLGHTSVTTTEIYAKINPRIKEEQILKHGASLNVECRFDKSKKEDLIDWLVKNF